MLGSAESQVPRLISREMMFLHKFFCTYRKQVGQGGFSQPPEHFRAYDWGGCLLREGNEPPQTLRKYSPWLDSVHWVEYDIIVLYHRLSQSSEYKNLIAKLWHGLNYVQLYVVWSSVRLCDCVMWNCRYRSWVRWRSSVRRSSDTPAVNQCWSSARSCSGWCCVCHRAC